MKRRATVLFALLLAFLLPILTACGAGGRTAAPPASAPQASENKAEWGGSTGSGGWEMDMAAPAPAPSATPPIAPMPDGGAVYRDENAKLIRRASLWVQTTEFDAAVGRLAELVNQYGGYYQSANVYTGGYRSNYGARSGDYLIRIPAGQLDAFLSQSGSLGHVSERSESSEDIGEQYYDTEARLATQKAKHERLLSLLKQAATMEDIIQLENALSETEYAIESYSSTLNRYDGLVGYATVNLSLSEVIEIVSEPDQTASLGQQLRAGLAASWRGLTQGLQDLLIWGAYNLFGLAIFAAIAGAVVLFALRGVRRAKGQGKLSLRKKGPDKDGRDNPPEA